MQCIHGYTVYEKRMYVCLYWLWSTDYVQMCEILWNKYSFIQCLKWRLTGEAGWHCWEYTAGERSTGHLVTAGLADLCFTSPVNLNSKLHYTSAFWQLIHNRPQGLPRCNDFWFSCQDFICQHMMTFSSPPCGRLFQVPHNATPISSLPEWISLYVCQLADVNIKW